MPDPINRYMQWPLNPTEGDIFTSDAGKTWIFKGCGWVKTCCPPVITCDPEVSGISVIFNLKNGGLIAGYGVSYFTWNSNLNRYEGFIEESMVIQWTGTEWQLILSRTGQLIATSSTSNILTAAFTFLVPEWSAKHAIEQIKCGLIYNQLCLATGGPVSVGDIHPGPYTLYPNGYDSIADIMAGAQSNSYMGRDSNDNYVSLDYNYIDGVWYMNDNIGNAWIMNTTPTQNGLILGSLWSANTTDSPADFSQGVCETECYPQRDGITVMYFDGSWTPIHLTWDPVNSWYYSDNPVIEELWGWYWIRVEYDLGSDIIRIVIDQGSGPQSIAGNSYSGDFSTRLFNHGWEEHFDVYCGDVGCQRMCATFNGHTTTMIPVGYNSIDSILKCNGKFHGWAGWNGTNEVISFAWNDGPSEYRIDIGGHGWQLIPVTSYTSAALIASSPYSYSQGGLSGTLTLTLGDC